MKHLAILMDMHGRLGPIEGAVEGLLAQNREYLTRLKALEVKLDTLASENRQWRRHVERLMRAKEVLLERAGVESMMREYSHDKDVMRNVSFSDYCETQR